MWGSSPPLDFQQEIVDLNNDSKNIGTLECLTVGAIDARHIVKTLASTYIHSNRIINFHVIESCVEHVARSILFLNICLESDLGLQEASRYYLEIYGNTLFTPATAKYLAQTGKRLIDIVTQTIPCPWLNIEALKYKERDLLEAIFKFWIRAVCEGLPIVEYWDRRIRKALGTRYDYRDGVFDWDYHMVLTDRKISHLTLHEYKFWRNNGIAFTWIEAEPARCNPTLINNITPQGSGFIHYAYLGDITNGPFMTWTLDEVDEKPKLRATDKAEKQIIKSFYQIRNRQQCPDEIIAAHRDQSLLTGTLITDMPDMGVEHESWVLDKEKKINKSCGDKDTKTWIDVPNFKIKFHSASNCEKYRNKNEWKETINIAFVAYNLINQLPNITPLVKKSGLIIVELCRFIVEMRKEDQEKFSGELKEIAKELGLSLIHQFNPLQDNFARFIKEDNLDNLNHNNSH